MQALRRRPVVRARAGLAAVVLLLCACQSSTGGPSEDGGAPGSAPPASTGTPEPIPGLSAGGPMPGPESCVGAGRTVSAQAVTRHEDQWMEDSPADDVTFDLTGVTSTAYPARESVFAVGTDRPAARTCVIGGVVHGQADDDKTWDHYHDKYNAACLKIIATGWIQVHGLRCDNVEDGFKPQESSINANDTQFYVSGTHLTRIRDDCMENDYTVGGVLHDNLWEQCNTGISERPSRDRSWRTPRSETLVLDRMLIGLYQTPHREDGEVVMGENALFKWSESGNRVVIRCSTFMVDAVSLNGTDAMAFPPGTVVDDAACPDAPSTLVWLGGGAEYPAWSAGIRVVTDEAVWTEAVAAWKAAHRDQETG